MTESKQLKFIFTMNYEGNVWLFLLFNKTVQKSLLNLDYCILILLCFWQQNQNILPEFRLMYWLTYYSLPVDLMWITCTLPISQGSSGYSSIHKVYSEFRVWFFEEYTFPQDSFFDTTSIIFDIFNFTILFSTLTSFYVVCTHRLNTSAYVKVIR